jgi:hypothetical protein
VRIRRNVDERISLAIGTGLVDERHILKCDRFSFLDFVLPRTFTVLKSLGVCANRLSWTGLTCPGCQVPPPARPELMAPKSNFKSSFKVEHPIGTCATLFALAYRSPARRRASSTHASASRRPPHLDPRLGAQRSGAQRLSASAQSTRTGFR